MHALLQICQELGIKLNKDKCVFCTKNINFMGHVLTPEGLKVDDSKVKVILKMPWPTSVAEIQCLQGTVGYLAQFMPNLSGVMQPLLSLTHKESRYTWTDA